MSGFQTPTTISDVIRRINNNSLLLPSFQREFVWRADQVENLFDSLMRGYPISSMLWWKVEGDAKSKYKFYSFLRSFIQIHKTYGEPFQTQSVNDFHAVLDGQQRLTSLYLGLCGTYAHHRPYYGWNVPNENNFPPRQLYLNISRVNNSEEAEKMYLFDLREVKETKGLKIWIDSKGDKWFKVSEIIPLHNGAQDYDIDDFQEENGITKAEKKVLKKLERVIFTDLVINFYEESDSNPDRAVNIFTRINSGGTNLSLSDILFSMVIAQWRIDAKEEINSLVSEVNSMGFNIKAEYVLRAFLSLYGKEVQYKIRNFTNDFIHLLEQNWGDIKNSIRELFKLLRAFGFDNFTLTSYNATQPILYYLHHSGKAADFDTKIACADERKSIKHWLLKALLFQRFGGSSDSTLKAARSVFLPEDDRSLVPVRNLDRFPAEEMSRILGFPSKIGDELIDPLLEEKKESKRAFSILSMLFPDLDYANVRFHQDHLHPISSFWGDPLYDVANSIVNLQLLQANENESKGDTPLRDWVAARVANGMPLTDALQSSLIPAGVSLDRADFAAFAARRAHLRDRLRARLTE